MPAAMAAAHDARAGFLGRCDGITQADRADESILDGVGVPRTARGEGTVAIRAKAGPDLANRMRPGLCDA